MPAFNYTLDVKETGDAVSMRVEANSELKAEAYVSISEFRVQNWCNVTITEREN